jgi:ribosomal protein S18 acetylase RimI-like enzyme
MLATEPFTLRQAAAEDIEGIVVAHLQSFPEFFLTCLGRPFLRRLYHGILTDASGVVLVAEANGTIMGFVAGVLDQSSFYRRQLLCRGLSYLWAALPAMIHDPRIVIRVLRSVKRPRQAQGSVSQTCLMSLGVLPSAQGRGVGRQLVSAFCHTVAEKGARSVSLTTDALSNDSVNKFYQGLGFVISQVVVTAEGRRLNEYSRFLEGVGDRESFS